MTVKEAKKLINQGEGIIRDLRAFYEAAQADRNRYRAALERIVALEGLDCEPNPFQEALWFAKEALLITHE